MYRISKLDTTNISDEVLLPYLSFVNQWRAETSPDDPPRTAEYFRKGFAALQGLSDWKEDRWLARQGNEVVGEAWGGFSLVDNLHLLEAGVYVLPEHRRQGLGGRLLLPLTELAEAEERRLSTFYTTSKVPAGLPFVAALGARRGIDEHTNQLELAQVDRELLRAWQTGVPAEFDIGCWEDTVPEENVEAACKLIEQMNSEPRGDVEVEDWTLTPERLREQEAYNATTGIKSWMMYVRHRASGEFAGYTETGWQADVPTVVEQWGTTVKPEYRGRGLGRWLKAAMLEKVLNERPEAEFVRTGNADINAPMLAINRALGFKPYKAFTLWQADVAALKTYAEKRDL